MKVKHKIALRYIKTKLNLLSVINKKKAGEEVFRLFCTPLKKGKTEVHEVFKYAEPVAFVSDGKSIKGYRCNKGGTKKILLLHGFSSNCQHFGRYVQPLVSKGYEVLAFDAPAHGRSEGITSNAMDYSEMITKVNVLYGPVNGYIAHSFGGISVMLALENIPHSTDTHVVLIAPATETNTAIDGAFNMLALNNKPLRKVVDNIILEKSGRTTEWFSIRRAIKNISAQILWIHDKDDDITPLSDALKVKDDKPQNVRFLITSSLGHRRIYRDPAVIQHVVNFL
jgi:esterase/lipase